MSLSRLCLSILDNDEYKPISWIDFPSVTLWDLYMTTTIGHGDRDHRIAAHNHKHRPNPEATVPSPLTFHFNHWVYPMPSHFLKWGEALTLLPMPCCSGTTAKWLVYESVSAGKNPCALSGQNSGALEGWPSPSDSLDPASWIRAHHSQGLPFPQFKFCNCYN